MPPAAGAARSGSARSCGGCGDEFPDISISKIRFLEDEGLLGAAADAGRLPALQRGRPRAAADDPAAAARRVPAAARDQGRAGRARARPSASGAGRPALGEQEESIDLDELCRARRRQPELAKELEDFGLLAPHGSGGDEALPRDRRRRRRGLRAADALRRRRRGTCGRSGRRPTGRRRCSSSSSRRRCARRNAERRAPALRDLQ